MKYIFPVHNGIISTGFYDKRPYSVPPRKRKYYHKAWDLTCRQDARRAIEAPEDGEVFFHVIHRYPTSNRIDLSWSDTGGWYMFSNFYYDSMGCVTVLMGKSGYIYMFGHQEEDTFMDAVRVYHRRTWWQEKQTAYDDYVRWLVTFNELKKVKAGSIIGYIGNAGYSSGYHTHMQIHANRNYNSRIDPAELWRYKEINDNGDGPRYGIKPGAAHIIG